jgi:hypothetical protein
MTEDVIVDKAKFDAMLKRLIRAKPTTLEQVKAKPKRERLRKTPTDPQHREEKY